MPTQSSATSRHLQPTWTRRGSQKKQDASEVRQALPEHPPRRKFVPVQPAPRPSSRVDSEPEKPSLQSQLRTVRSDGKVRLSGREAEGGCANCERALLVDGEWSVCGDEGRLFCGSNCLWSFKLDTNGSRLKVAKRRARLGRETGQVRRRKRRTKVGDEGEEREERSIRGPGRSGEERSWCHAMFLLHETMFCDDGV